MKKKKVLQDSKIQKQIKRRILSVKILLKLTYLPMAFGSIILFVVFKQGDMSGGGTLIGVLTALGSFAAGIMLHNALVDRKNYLESLLTMGTISRDDLKRKKGKTYSSAEKKKFKIGVALFCVGLVTLGIFLPVLGRRLGLAWYAWLTIYLIGVPVTVFGFVFGSKYQTELEKNSDKEVEKAVLPILKEALPFDRFSPKKHVDLDVRAGESVTGSCLIRGKFNKTEYEFSNVSVLHKSEYDDKKIPVFSGWALLVKGEDAQDAAEDALKIALNFDKGEAEIKRTDLATFEIRLRRKAVFYADFGPSGPKSAKQIRLDASLIRDLLERVDSALHSA